MITCWKVFLNHIDVMIWKHFRHHWPFATGIHHSPSKRTILCPFNDFTVVRPDQLLRKQSSACVLRCYHVHMTTVTHIHRNTAQAIVYISLEYFRLCRKPCVGSRTCDMIIAERIHMMTSSNGNIFRVTCHLCWEFTGHRWISHTKASDAELWCFLWSAPE